MINARTASSRGNAVVNGSILRATFDRSSLNREKERQGLQFALEKSSACEARPIKDERRRRYVSVSRWMHAAERRKSIYHDRNVTPDIRARRSTIYRLTVGAARSLRRIRCFVWNPKTQTFLSFDFIQNIDIYPVGVFHLLWPKRQ